jgi:D-glycero-beta-D-manno-heptose 1-phosphate adenylyltransferase
MIYSIEQLQTEIDNNRDRWRPLVFTNGCFDLLHPGHVRYLQGAKALGKSLVVGLNSDASVRKIKPPQPGKPDRPIVIAEHRGEVLAALRAVDGVVIFDEPTASNLISVLRPDIYVKGGDYAIENLPEAPTVQAYGGKIQLIRVEVPTSTTAIVQKILSVVDRPSVN